MDALRASRVQRRFDPLPGRFYDRSACVTGSKRGIVPILIAIPVFNELGHVERVLEKVHRFADEILCIDDGSTDGTAELLARRRDIRLIHHGRNLGYGRSIIDAFDYAGKHGFDWVITMDCDEQHEPEAIPEFMQLIETGDYDLISGSRYLKSRDDNDLPPPDRRSINVALTAVLNVLFGWGLTDAFCGFKAHRTSEMVKLRLDEAGYAFPLQFWPRVAAAKLRVTELPVRLIYNDPNRTFGGNLDDAYLRMKHYLDVLHRELHREPVASLEPRDCAACFCRASEPVSA
ncbi:MAG: glycosyltransferase family 2 protein [Phycisphaerae bacterium]|nr:glycosyltransferase family 2 protein [Phycisphaerae bacterium]MDW8261598.1 glycosyltransferase family 2 protein [Phycisphaerales bacterium]